MAKKDKLSKLLKIKEAAEILNVHPETLRRWDEKGILKAIKIGKRGDRRYKKEDILAFCEGKPNKKR